jgi:NAD(P)H dehydrogenase (quinone)
MAQSALPSRAAEAAPAIGPTVLVAYDSRTGATEALSAAVEEGARSLEGTRVTRKRVDTVTEADLLAADALILGSPVHNAGVSGEAKAFIDRWPFEKMQNKVGAVFVAAGGTSAGEEVAAMAVIAAMLVHRLVIVGGGTWQGAFGASAITEEGQPADQQGKTSAAAREKARALGHRVAEVARATAPLRTRGPAAVSAR